MSIVTDPKRPGDLLDCGHVCQDAGQHRPGNYGYRTADNSTACDTCLTASELDYIANASRGDVLCAYLSGDGRTVTMWTGEVLMSKVQRGADHPFSESHFNSMSGRRGADRFYVSAWDSSGHKWHGVAGLGMYTNLRRCKD